MSNLPRTQTQEARLVWRSTQSVALEWGISVSRVKLLCQQGRIKAKRSKTGRGSPWKLRAEWNGSAHVVSITPKAKGPKLRAYLLSNREEIPL